MQTVSLGRYIQPRSYCDTRFVAVPTTVFILARGLPIFYIHCKSRNERLHDSATENQTELISSGKSEESSGVARADRVSCNRTWKL